MDAAKRNKAIVRRLYEELNKGNWDIAEELIVADYTQHSILPVPQGREGFKQFFAQFGAAFPDANFIIEDMIAEKDKVAVRFTGRFTHKSEFMGIPPTGKQIKMMGIDIFRISNGKIVEHWEEVDMYSSIMLSMLKWKERTQP